MLTQTPRRLLVATALGALVFTWSVSPVSAGGPPREDNFVLDVTYLGCVDDEVEEPGIDGRALVRVRLTSAFPEDVVIDPGEWRLVAGGETVAQASFAVPADLVDGATWEQVVVLPGGTGPAVFSAVVDVTGPLGTSTFVFDPVDVPGDCPQPEVEPTTTAVAPAEPAAVVVPRLTG